MPTKKQINIRVSDLTEQQIDALAARWGTSITETVTVLVDRAYQKEMTMDRAINDLRQNGMDKCERCGATWSAVDLQVEETRRNDDADDRPTVVVAHCCCAACGEQRWYRVP